MGPLPLIRASIDADLLAEATRKRQAEIAARADRAERRKQAFRAAAFALMDLAGIARLPEPDFCARIQPGQPHLAELDLDALPPELRRCRGDRHASAIARPPPRRPQGRPDHPRRKPAPRPPLPCRQPQIGPAR